MQSRFLQSRKKNEAKKNQNKQKHFKYLVVHHGIVRIKLHCVATVRLLMINLCLSCAIQEKLTVVLKPPPKAHPQIVLTVVFG